MLSEIEKQFLLQTARRAIELECSGTTSVQPGSDSVLAAEPSGVFVTLHHSGELRGCIGFIETEQPLAGAVEETAVKAASEDPRFAPVRSEELEDLEIEISVLSPLRQIHNVDDITVGTDGIVVEFKRRRGVLLPQVAVEYGWDAREFLSQTIMKAGLPPSVEGEPGFRIFAFSAEIFSDARSPSVLTDESSFRSEPLTDEIRMPAVAGAFYPGAGDDLRKEVFRLLKLADPSPQKGTILGLIAPHAGYLYSGLTAAYGYRLLEGKRWKTVVIVSPSHCEYFEGISVYPGSGYATPLGTLKINASLRDRLVKGEARIRISSSGHGEEHAVEVQLPFLQCVLNDVMILPIVMGDQGHEDCLRLGRKLAEILRGEEALLVASSDLSHYHTYEVANSLDKRVIDAIGAFREVDLMDDLEAERVEACGGGPIVAVLRATRALGADAVSVLDHRNSGDVCGDRSRVVGYCSAVAYRSAR